MISFNTILENRALRRPRLGPPDYYPQDPNQKEDELTSVNVKQGFINQPAFFGDNGEHGSALHYTIDVAKLNKSFSDILLQKQVHNTYNDTGKKRPPLTKDNFWLVPVAKNRNHLQQWIKELRGGKSLTSLGRKVPIFTKKEEVFQTLAEHQITIVRGTWYIKMTAAYSVIQAEAKNKKNRNTVDLNPEWTAAICRFMRDQLSRLLDDPLLSNAPGSILPVLIQQSKDETERHFNYICKIAHHLFSEGMLDRHDFLNWIVETMEKIRLHGTHALSYVIPLVNQYIQEIVNNQLLSRRLAYVATRLLSWLLNDATWGAVPSRPQAESPLGPLSVGPPSVPGQQQRQTSAPPTPGQSKPQSPQKNVAQGNQQNVASVKKPHVLPANFPDHLDEIAYALVCIVQCVTLECPGALVWYLPDDPKSPGSPLDYLSATPSVLPLPPPKNAQGIEEDKILRALLREREADIVQRSYAAEMRWSSDKCQESATGQTINRVLNLLEALDKQQNFDRTEPIEPLHSKIFAHSSSKENNDQASRAEEEAVIWLLCEWAISAKRLGEHRAAVVAKLLDKRQIQIENERIAEITERNKNLNSSGTSMTSNSNPTSVGTIMSSPPPQLLLEGVELPQQDLAPSQPAAVELSGTNTHVFQDLLFNFLDTQAPVLDEPADKEELQSFRNLVVLFSELIQHDVFSHDQYVSALITRGDIIPGQISPLPIYNPAKNVSRNSAMTPGHGSFRNNSVGMMSAPSVGPASVGGPVSNKQVDILLKGEVDDDLPLSVPSMDVKNESGDLPLFSPIATDFLLSPDGRERHFTDVLVDQKDKTPGGAGQSNLKKPNGPIWGYRQPRHMQFLMHFPISFEDDSCIHESNQRLMVLYGASRQRNEVKKAVKKITKYVCKLIQKKSVTSPESVSGVPSTGVPSVGGSRKKNRSVESPSSMDVLLKRFRCLSYFDQHAVTWQAAKAIISSFNDYMSDRSHHLPHMSSITTVLNLMEDALNIGGMVQLAVQIASTLVALETEIEKKHPFIAKCYTKNLALNVVAVLRHYQSYFTLNVDLTLQAFECMHAFVKQSNIMNPGNCTSSDRCVLIFLYDLYSTFPYRYKHVTEAFAGLASAIQQTVCLSKIPATSNCRYDILFMIEYIRNPGSANLIKVAQQNCQLLAEATYKYSFVCSAIITMCSGQPNPESLSALATLCAEMNAQCNDLSSEWLGVLKALCCSSYAANFNDVLLSVDPGEVMIRDPLALFTAILVARSCLSLSDFIQHVAIPSLLAACASPSKAGVDVSDAETGARLTCHILLQLFTTPTHPSQRATTDATGTDRPEMYLPEAADRHLLAACQRNIVVGAVLAVLKAIVKLGDASFGGRRSSSPTDNDTGVTSFLAPIGGLDECDDFGLGGQPVKPSTSSGGSLDTASLSEFAKHAVRVICSQQWVRERCLKNIEWDFLLDPEVTIEQRQNLIQLICCPGEELQRLADNPQDQQTYVVRILHRMSRWTLRQTLLELQIMLKQTCPDESLSDDIAKAVIEVFKSQQGEPTKDRKSPITGLELDKSNVWLMPPLVSELSSQVQAKVLHEASHILETSQHWSRSKSDRDRQNRNPASLLSQQPFLTLILTCLKGQDEQRGSLLDSLQQQILMFHSEWQSGRQQQQRDVSGSKDNVMSQSVVQEALQLRLSLMGGMFDTVENSTHWTSSVVVLLTQLIHSGMVDVEVNAKLFHTVFDMIAVLLHSTLGGDSPGSGEGKKRDYMNIVKKIKKEISDSQSASLHILRRLLPIPKKETFVIACEPIAPGTERQGLQIASKQKVVPWDIIGGLKNTAPLCLSWFGATKTERKELPFEVQQRQMLYHDHEFWQRPLSEYMKPPVLPEEEEEKPPTPKIPEKKRKPTTSASRSKSPGSTYVTKDAHNPPKKAVAAKRKRPKKSQDLSVPFQGRQMGPMQSLYGPTTTQMMSQMQPNPMQVHPTGGYGNPAGGNNYNMFHNQVTQQQPVGSGPYTNPTQQAKVLSSHTKHSLAQFLKTKSGQSGHYPQQPQPQQHGSNIHLQHSVHPQQPNENSKSAIRTMIRRNNSMTSGVPGDMAGMPYRSRQTSMMGPPMSSSLRHINTQPQQQGMVGYNSYGGTQQQQGGMGQMHPSMRQSAPSYNSFQGGGGAPAQQQQGYHQVLPNQSYMNQSQGNAGVAQGYSMGNMGMQGSGISQTSGYTMQGGQNVQNQSGMMGGQQPPQYGMMASQQQGRQMTRMNPQQQMGVSSQGGMMQMHGMGGGGQGTMGRQRQMINQQGMSMNSQYVQQQQTTQLVNDLRRNMPTNQGNMY